MQMAYVGCNDAIPCLEGACYTLCACLDSWLSVAQGVEYGFQSTTRDRSQAEHYAKGSGWAKPTDAMTIFEIQMGMIDRGAELTWVSQYPHERECLFPPLTGLETTGKDVEGQLLKIESRLSLNLSAQTLEQVLSRRRKMLTDMARGIEQELYEQLKEDMDLVRTSVKLLHQAFAYGALDHDVTWFNDDDNFAEVMQETLYLQRLLLAEIRRFHANLGSNDLDLRNWKARGPARIMLLAAWLRTRTNKNSEASIDLRGAHLQPKDGILLKKLLEVEGKVLTAVDVRNNESLGPLGSEALIDFITGPNGRAQPGRVFKSICGVTPASSRLVVSNGMGEHELSIVSAELCANVFGESIGSSMGEGGSKKAVSALNRRSTAFQKEWNPLIWASKVGNLAVVREVVTKQGIDVNATEDGKNNSGFCAAAYAVVKNHKEVLVLLAELGANLYAVDKHSQSVRSLAVKRNNKECLEILDKWAPATDDDASHAQKAGGSQQQSTNKSSSMSGWV